MSNVETVCTATHASNEIAVRSEDEVECSMVPSERAPTIQRRTMTDVNQSVFAAVVGQNALLVQFPALVKTQ